MCSNLVHAYTINKVYLAEIFRIIYHVLRQALPTSLTRCWNLTFTVSCIIMILIKITNKMQLYRIIYYSFVPWLLYMFRAILSLIIRSILTLITASASIHMCCCRLPSWLSHDSSYFQDMFYSQRLQDTRLTNLTKHSRFWYSQPRLHIWQDTVNNQVVYIWIRKWHTWGIS